MYINDIVKARTLASQRMAKQQQRRTPLRVGTDVLKMAEQRTQEIAPRALCFANSTAISEKFSNASQNPQGEFESYTLEKSGFSVRIRYEKEQETGRMILMAQIVEGSYHDGNFSEHSTFEVTADTRISRATDGSFSVHTGKNSLTAGKLVGSGEDVLVRLSGVDVKAESGNISVVNLRDGGTFDGGNAKMTYVGNFYKATINAGHGGNTFGVTKPFMTGTEQSTFTDCTINAGDNDNVYEGYFIGSLIHGGSGRDIFQGVFDEGNVLHGNDGDDSFVGYFKGSKLTGGDGKNTFFFKDKTHDSLESTFTQASMQFIGVPLMPVKKVLWKVFLQTVRPLPLTKVNTTSKVFS